MTSENLAVKSVCPNRYFIYPLFALFLLTSVCSFGQRLSPADYPVVWLRADNTGALNGFWKDATGQMKIAAIIMGMLAIMAQPTFSQAKEETPTFTAACFHSSYLPARCADRNGRGRFQ